MVEKERKKKRNFTPTPPCLLNFPDFSDLQSMRPESIYLRIFKKTNTNITNIC